MPDFSIEYKTTVEDAVETSLALTKPARQKRAILLTVFAIVCMIGTCMISGEIYSIFIFGFIALAFPLTSYLGVKNNASKSIKKNADGMHPMRIDFFPDHIEKHTCVDRKIKSHEEIHYPLEAIRIVVETKKMFIFSISPVELLSVPKRAVKEEDRQRLAEFVMINFSRKYKKM